MTELQPQNSNTQQENQGNNPTAEQLKRRRRTAATARWRAKNPDKVAIIRKKQADKKREAYRLRTGCQPKRTYWRDMAREPKAIYQVKNLNEASALRKAIIKRGFHASASKTVGGYKVYKRKLAYE